MNILKELKQDKNLRSKIEYLIDVLFICGAILLGVLVAVVCLNSKINEYKLDTDTKIESLQEENKQLERTVELYKDYCNNIKNCIVKGEW